MKAAILVCYHKPDNYIDKEGYLPIHVGKAIAKQDLGLQGDDTGDNISSLNPYFCELTAMYWAWKNLKDTDYVGLCHYRRFINFKSVFPPFDKTVYSYEEFSKMDMSLPDLDRIFSEYDVVCPYQYYLKYNVFHHYAISHSSIDMKICTEVINELYPEYMPDVYYVMSRNRFSPANMMIMRKADFDSYCKWLFDILFEVSKRISTEKYPVYQKRVFGYLSERLFEVYLVHNKMKVKSVGLIYLDDNSKPVPLHKRIRRALERRLKYCFSRTSLSILG